MLSNKRSRKISRLQVGAVLAVAVLGASPFTSYVKATDYSENGGTALDASGSWTPAAPAHGPVSTDNAIFDSALLPGGPYNFTFSNDLDWGMLTIGSPGVSTISSGTNSLSLEHGITMNGTSSLFTINSAMFVNQTQTWQSAGGTLSFGGVVDLGFTNLTFDGPGVIQQNTNTTGIIQNGSITKNGTGTLVLSSSINSFSALTLNNGVILAQSPTVTLQNPTFAQGVGLSGVLGGGGGSNSTNSGVTPQWNLNGGTLTLQMTGVTLYGDVNVNGNVLVTHLGVGADGNPPTTGFGTSFGGAFHGSGTLTFDSLVPTGQTVDDGLGMAPGAFQDFHGVLNLEQTANGQPIRILGSTDAHMDFTTVNVLGTQNIFFATRDMNGNLTIGSLATTDVNASLQGNTNGNTVNFNIGSLNTNTTWAGQVNNGATTPIITKIGTGSLTLSNSSVSGFSGRYVAAGGTLEVSLLNNNAFTLGSSNGSTVLRYIGTQSNLSLTNALTISGSGATLESSGVNAINLSSSAIVTQTADSANTPGGVVTIRSFALGGSNVGNNTFAGSLQNFGTINTTTGLGTITNSLVKTGASAWMLTGTTSTYSGGTFVSGGTLIVNATTGTTVGTGTIAISGSGTFSAKNTLNNVITVASGGTLSPGVLAVNQGLDALTIGGSNNVTTSTGATLAFNVAPLPAATGLLKMSTGTLNLTGLTGVALNNAITSSPFIYDGVFTLATFAGTANFLDGGSVLAAGSTITNLAYTGAGTAHYVFTTTGKSIQVTVTGGITNANWLGGGANNTWTNSTLWSDVTPNGSGQLAQFGTGSTDTGATTVLVNGAAKTVGGIGFDNRTANGVSYTIAGSQVILDNTAQNNANAQIALSNVAQSQTLAMGGGLKLNSNTTITTTNVANTLTISAPLITPAANMSVSVTGPGKVILNNQSSADSFTGAFTINVASGANVFLGNGTTSGSLTAGSGGVPVLVNNSGNFVYNNPGSLTLNFNVAGNGTFGVATGILALGAGQGSLSTTTVVSPSAGALFNLNGLNTTLGNIAGNGTISNLTGSVTLTLNPQVVNPTSLTVGTFVNSINTTFSGLLADGPGAHLTLAMGPATNAGTLSVGTTVAPGTLVLSGANTYTGGTIFNFNTLQTATGAIPPAGTATPIGTPGSIVVANNQALGTGMITVKGLGTIATGLGGHDLILANGINLANNITFSVQQVNGLSGFTSVLPNSSATLSGNIINRGSDVGGTVALNALMRLGTQANNSTLTLTGLVDSTELGGGGTGLALTEGNFVIGPSGSLTSNSTGTPNDGTAWYIGSTFGSNANVLNATFLGNSGISGNRGFVDNSTGPAGVIGGANIGTTTVTMKNNSVINVNGGRLDWNGSGTTAINLQDNSSIIAGQFQKGNETGNTLVSVDGGTLKTFANTFTWMPGSKFTKIALRPGGMKIDTGITVENTWAQGISGNIVNVVNASFENNTTTTTTAATPTNYGAANRLQATLPGGTAPAQGTIYHGFSGVATNGVTDGSQALFITGVGDTISQNIGALATGTTYTVTVSMAARGVQTNATAVNPVNFSVGGVGTNGAATGFVSVVDGGSDIGPILATSGPVALGNGFAEYNLTFTTGATLSGNTTLVLSQLTPNNNITIGTNSTTQQVQLLADNIRVVNNSQADGGVTMLGTGTFTLTGTDYTDPTTFVSGASTYVGRTDIGSETVIVDRAYVTSKNSVFRVAGTGVLEMDFGSVDGNTPGNSIGGLDGNGSTTGVVRGSGLVNVNVAKGTEAVYGGNFGNGGGLSLVVSGGGTQTLNGVVNYHGGTESMGGTLNFASNTASSAGDFLIGAGESTVRSTFNGTQNTVTFTNMQARGIGGTVMFETIGGSGSTNNFVFSSFISAPGIISPGAFLRANGGAADFAYANSSGVLTAVPWGTTGFASVSGGNLSANQYNRVTGTGTENNGNDTVSGLNIQPSTTLTVNGAVLNIGGGVILKTGGGSGTIAGAGSITATLTSPELVFRTDSATDVLEVSTKITGAFPLLKTGLGTLRLSGVNSYTGTTTILNGTIDVGSLNALANTTVNYLSTGGALSVSAASANIGGLNGDHVLQINPGISVNVGNAAGLTTAFSGGFSGSGDFHKIGTGFAQISGPATSTFTGRVFLDSGTMQIVNGSALGTGAGSLVLAGGTSLLYGAANLPFTTADSVVVNGSTGSSVSISRLTGNTTDTYSGAWSSPTAQNVTMALPTASTLLLNGSANQFTAFSGSIALGASGGTLRIGGLNGAAGTDVGMNNVVLDVGSATVGSNNGGIQTIGMLTSSSTSAVLTGIVASATTGSSTTTTTYSVDSLGSSTYQGNIANTSNAGLTALFMAGTASILTLAGVSKSYSGGTTIAQGGSIVALPNSTSGTFSMLGTGAVTMAGSTSTLTFATSTAFNTQTVGNIGAGSGSTMTTNNATLGNVIVNANASVTSGMIRTGALAINGSLTLANNSAVSKVTSLSIAHTNSGTSAAYSGVLQLGNSRMILQTADSTSKAAAILSINEALFAGRGTAGTWTGTKGITSSATAANTAQLTVAVYDNANLGSRANLAGGIGNGDANSLLITPALRGDVNLDGVVNINDLVLIGAHWQETGKSAGGISTLDMTQGDVNQDGVVNINDLVLAGANWQGTSSFNSAIQMLADGTAPGEGAPLSLMLSPAAVPEPASIALLALGSAALLTRRRSKK